MSTSGSAVTLGIQKASVPRAEGEAKAKAEGELGGDAVSAQAVRDALGDHFLPEVDATGDSLVVSVPQIGVDFRSKDVQAILRKFSEICGESIEVLSSPDRAISNTKPRIELRQVINGVPPGANIALAFPDAKARNDNLNDFTDLCKDFSIVSAGSTTLEIGTKNVDKGTVLHYLSIIDPSKILPNYTPGGLIDAVSEGSILAMDADGTLWEKPKVGEDPTAQNLSNSPCQEQILNYLKAGGILAVISGNDPERTVLRFKEGIPEGQEHLLNNVILSGAGGHTLMVADQEGQFSEYKGYREQALGIQSFQKEDYQTTDIVYIGDDHKQDGNDIAGFNEVGMDRSVCVTQKKKDSCPAILQDVVVNGGPIAVGHFVSRILEKRQLTEGGNVPLFGPGTKALLSSTQSDQKSVELTSDTVQKLGSVEDIRDIVHGLDSANRSSTYTATKMDTLLKTVGPILEGDETALDFDGITRRADTIAAALGESHEEYYLTNNMKDQPFESQMKETLDKMDLQEGSVVRILEPGNNDQLTPIHVARMVSYIRGYAEGKGIGITTQVIVMGKGGHATTGLWHQFAELSAGDFSGTDEATSLSATLIDALKEKGINGEKVEKFSSEPGAVQIKLERESTNTGENMDRAKEAHENADGPNPTHIFLASATPSSRRQALTAAAQYSENRYNLLATKLYEELTAIPFERSRSGLNAYNEKQIVTEMYASLAETARFYLYGYRKSGRYIPAGPLGARDKRELENLYQVYAKLTGKVQSEAKKVPMDEVMKFFGDRFAVMESSIPWVKEEEVQTLSVKKSMQRARLQMDFEKLAAKYQELPKSAEERDETQNKIAWVYKLYEYGLTSGDKRVLNYLHLASNNFRKLAFQE